MSFEEKFRSKILVQEAQWQAEKAWLQAEKEDAVKQVIGLFKQGYTPEQMEQMLSQESGLQPATT
jgi:hypothetical protein